MTRVMYITFNNPDLSPGVFRKEQEFCHFFGKIGKDHNMEFKGLCIVTSQEEKLESINLGDYFEIKKIPSLPYRIFSHIPFYCSLFRIRPVYTQAYKDILSFHPDIIIWRYNITYVPWIFNPKKLSPKTLLISEHQAKELEELCMTRAGRFFAPLISWIRTKVMGNVDAVIGVTSEITSYELALIGRTIPSFTLTNSIDVESYQTKRDERPLGNLLRLLYVGSHTAVWQGLDRVLRGMAEYHGDRQIELHVAGNLDSSTKRLIQLLGITDKVVSHGYLVGKELDKLFDISDLAIGTLGMHRKHLTYGSTLKVREYMARGMPFIISYKDEDISSDLPYVFYAPADDSPLNFHEIIPLLDKLYQDYGQELSQNMRTYALKHMDSQFKTVKLLEFIKTLRSRS